MTSVRGNKQGSDFFVASAPKVVLLCAPQMLEIGQAIVKHTKTVVLGQISWKKFPDGFPNIFVNDVEAMKGCHLVFLACFQGGADIFEQISVLHSLPQYAPQSLQIILPFFPVGTMERVDKEGEIATARTLARIVSSIPPSRGGPVDMVIFDIHALQERFYFGDNIVPILESAVPLIIRRLESEHSNPGSKPGEGAGEEAWVIAFPDQGAFTRYHSMFAAYETIVCMKVRYGDSRKITVKEGNPKDKHIVLVDDMIQSGGTLLETGKALLALGAKSVSAFCTHGVFPNDAYKKFLDGTFRKVWITDSCPEMANKINGQGPFEVLSLAPLIAQIIDLMPSATSSSSLSQGARLGLSRL